MEGIYLNRNIIKCVTNDGFYALCKQSFKTDCCLTNSDAHVIGGSEDGMVFFWDLVDAKVVSKFRAHDLVVTSVSYHPKEDCMLTSSVDGTVRVWKR